METKMTLDQIQEHLTELAAVIGDAEWHDPNFGQPGYFRACVAVANSTTDGDDAYERSCDEAIGILRAGLPGWKIEWAGTGNTDGDGDCTEDIHCYPPESL